jgi:RsiW-degrading membrane proteinase PrsW (M82 family)
MPIPFSYPCGKKFQAKDELAGKRVKCRACGTLLTVPAAPAGHDEDADDEPAPAPAPPRAPRPAAAATAPRAPAASLERYQHILNKPEEKTSLQEYFYWLLPLALIPLAISLISAKDENLEKRFERTLAKAPPASQVKVVELERRFLERALEATKDDPKVVPADIQVPVEELLPALPDQRLEGAHLSRGSLLHWAYGIGAAVVFFLVTLFLFPEIGEPLRVLLFGLFTGTLGILLLFLFQWLADWTQGYVFISRNIILLVVYWTAWAIGFSYRAAFDPTVGFLPSFLGYTFGVGFCEEVCKALPIIFAYRADSGTTWRKACALGFASGLGFGIAEGIMYAGSYYNGIAPLSTYLVRFISCVALHGIWSAAVALFIHKHQALIQGELRMLDYIPRLVFLVSVPMVLHGLYDTFLKKNLGAAALVTAAVSFGWLVWRIEGARKEEQPAPGGA